MVNQWLEETDNGVLSWDVLQHYSGELMALALVASVALTVLFAWRARVVQRQANRIVQSKSDFLSMVSHEIRTPMHAILAAGELLQRSWLDRRQRELIAAAGSAADALSGLLDDVLDLSKMDAQRLELEQVPTDLVALVEAVIGAAGIKAAEKGLPILLESQIPENIDVGVDPTRMRQVVLNLLVNAVRFTERGSVSVDLRLLAAADASRAPSQLEVTVRDTGIGIPAEQQGRLFTPFTQADIATTRLYGGTGLGLTICRKLIALMQGTLVLQSEAGVGTTIRCTIPVTTHARQCATQEQAGSLRQDAPTILIVDDHAVNRLVIQRQLEELGCIVVLAEDGPRALALLAYRRCQLVLLDCYMPDLDGYQVAREIRKSDAGSARRTPIIAISAAVDAEHAQRCSDAGMDGILKKPIRLDDLRNLVEAWCDIDLSLFARAAVPNRHIDEQLKKMFRDSAKQSLGRIHQILRGHDQSWMATCLHRMKGAAMTLELSEIVEACEKFEYILEIQQCPNTTYIAPLEFAFAELRMRVAQF